MRELRNWQPLQIVKGPVNKMTTNEISEVSVVSRVKKIIIIIKKKREREKKSQLLNPCAL